MGTSTQVVRFHNHSLEIVEIDGKKGFTSKTVGKALGYAQPRTAVSKIFKRNEDEFEEGIDYHDTKMVARKNTHDLRIYFQTGVNLIGMFSKQPLAKDFRRWAKHVLASNENSNWRSMAFSRFPKPDRKRLRRAYKLRSIGLPFQDIGRSIQMDEHKLSLFFTLFGDPHPGEVQYKELPIPEVH